MHSKPIRDLSQRLSVSINTHKMSIGLMDKGKIQVDVRLTYGKVKPGVVYKDFLGLEKLVQKAILGSFRRPNWKVVNEGTLSSHRGHVVLEAGFEVTEKDPREEWEHADTFYDWLDDMGIDARRRGWDFEIV